MAHRSSLRFLTVFCCLLLLLPLLKVTMASAKPAAEQKAMEGGEQEALDEMEKKVHKYSRGKAAYLGVRLLLNYFFFKNLRPCLIHMCMCGLCWVYQTLRDKKLKGQLAAREKLYGHSAKAAVQTEKVRLLILVMNVSGSICNTMGELRICRLLIFIFASNFAVALAYRGRLFRA